jgi:hypothetical protein
MITSTLKNTAMLISLFSGQIAFGSTEFKFEKVHSYWPTSCNIQEMSLRKDSRTFAAAGLHAVSGRITKAYLENQTSVVIEGETYGYTCERLAPESSNYIWRPQSISQNPNIKVYLQSKFETYFQIVYSDFFKFSIEVPAEKFFTAQDLNLVEQGKSPRHDRFSLVFVSFENDGNAFPWTASYEFKFELVNTSKSTLSNPKN